IAQLSDAGLVVYYGEGISLKLQQAISVRIPEIEFPHVEPLLQVLTAHHIDPQVGHYKTYVVPSRSAHQRDVLCLSKHDPSVKVFGFDVFADRVYAVQKNEAMISACVSARENASCGEAWVYTAPEYRGLGFAQKVVRAWAGSLTDAGKVPFYSHKLENTASANLAAKLGLQPVFEEIAISSQV
ncbi:MAG TPA: GNAT family N-acetyltransferase, partial [Anaerolineales bacterium]|nr:GNAT family N-acetyltransferase [Anaerolineales bacterium]